MCELHSTVKSDNRDLIEEIILPKIYIEPFLKTINEPLLIFFGCFAVFPAADGIVVIIVNLPEVRQYVVEIVLFAADNIIFAVHKNFIEHDEENNIKQDNRG